MFDTRRELLEGVRFGEGHRLHGHGNLSLTIYSASMEDEP